jgi:hypothetical protein
MNGAPLRSCRSGLAGDVPKYQIMPPLTMGEYSELRADIQVRGVQVAVEYDDDGHILDGHHRVQICKELGIDWPRVTRSGLSEDEKFTHARQLNLARRHLDCKQKRRLIAQQLRETPQVSNRQIARDLGCDDKTVATVRDGLESIAEIPQCDREASDGRIYPREREAPKRPATKSRPLKTGCAIDATIDHLSDVAFAIRMQEELPITGVSPKEAADKIDALANSMTALVRAVAVVRKRLKVIATGGNAVTRVMEP